MRKERGKGNGAINQFNIKWIGYRDADFFIGCRFNAIFGLMDVLNFAHGGLFAWGAYSGIWIYTNTGSFLIGIIGAIVTGFLLGDYTRNGLLNQFMETMFNRF